MEFIESQDYYPWASLYRQPLPGASFWQPPNDFSTYELNFGYNFGTDPSSPVAWQHVQHLQSNVERLELELSSLRSQINDQNIRGELDAERDQLKRELSSLSSQSAEEPDESISSPDTTRSNSGQPKRRKYRRRPKPDHNAPIRPLTAYAQFAVDIRKKYSSQGLSFSEIAKRIGVDWQDMPDNIRDVYLTRAADAKQKHEAKFRKYQETAAYRSYQQYLVDFQKKLERKDKA